MSAWIKQFFAPPVFQDDVEKTRLAAVYNVILWVAAIALLSGLVVINVLDPGKGIDSINVTVFVLSVVVLASIVLLHRGLVLCAALVMLVALYVGFSYIAYTNDGVRDSIVSGYYIVVVLASLTMNGRVLRIFGALCLIALIGAYFAEITGLIEGLADDPEVSDIIFLIAGLIVSAVLINHVIGRINRAYQEAQELVQEQTAQLAQGMLERERAQEENLRLQQEIIETQQQAIQELLTPVIPIVKHIIVMPLVGSIDTMRARDIMRVLLAGIHQHQAKVVILDITGVPVVDSSVANHLNKTIRAARLKGAHTIITGISDAVAETIVDLGIDWGEIETVSDLQTGLSVALKSMGIRGSN